MLSARERWLMQQAWNRSRGRTTMESMRDWLAENALSNGHEGSTEILLSMQAPPAPTLLTPEQRQALEAALLMPGIFGHRLSEALYTVIGVPDERDLARYLLAADARMAGGGA